MRETIIIGGGLIGIATLYELARRGAPARLLEAESELASVTSFANGGMLTPSMSDPWNSPGVGGHLMTSLFDPFAGMKLRLSAAPGSALWGLEFLRNSFPERHRVSTRANFSLADYSAKATLALARELDLEFDLSTTGTLKIFPDLQSMEAPLALSRMLEPSGLAFEPLDTAGVVGVEPRLAPVRALIAGGIHYPADRCGDARRFALGLAAKARALGADIRLRAVVAELLRDGDRVRGVRLAGGETLEGDVVVAAGLTSVLIARRVGLRLPIRPAKGYSLTLDTADLGDLGPGIAVIDEAMHAGVVPLGGRLRLVGTAEFAGEDRAIRPERIETLFRLLERIFPDVARRISRRTEQPWTGLRPMSADGRPFIGAGPLRGLWLNCGHGHLGWTMAVGSARALASLICGDRTEIDLSPFAWPRR